MSSDLWVSEKTSEIIKIVGMIMINVLLAIAFGIGMYVAKWWGIVIVVLSPIIIPVLFVYWMWRYISWGAIPVFLLIICAVFYILMKLGIIDLSPGTCCHGNYNDNYPE